jgi:acetyltransferase-like isoleucine patch superfamily enzyme
MDRKFFILLVNGLIYKFIIRFSVYLLGVLPLLLTIALLPGLLSLFNRVALLCLCVLLAPFIIIITTGLLTAIHPRQKDGPAVIFSSAYFTWLRRNLLHEIITCSTFLNNTLNRIDFVKAIYYRLAGAANPYLVIIAPNVFFLDPDRMVFGKQNFIGFNTMIAGHIIKGNRLLIQPVVLGDAVKIGAGCVISCGVSIGDNSKIDFGVTIGTNCRIGKDVTIFGETKIDDDVTIEDGAIVGKFCKIGKKATVREKAFVESFGVIKPRQVYES